MEESELERLIASLEQYARAKDPIDPELLKLIPHFTTIFPDRRLWPVIVKLSGFDGIAHFEKKEIKAGEKLIVEGRFDQMIYWILKGSAQVVIRVKGQSKVIHNTQAGECIGELGVLREAIRKADVVVGDGGAVVLELDWAITEKDSELGKYFYHLIALNLADKLDKAYDRQLHIISNSLKILHDKTTQLIERNRTLEELLAKYDITFASMSHADPEQALTQAIINLKESLSLLEQQEDRKNLDMLGVV